MLKAQSKVLIKEPTTKVWNLMGGFDSLPNWLPYIIESNLSEGGRVRTLKNIEGEIIIEKLEDFNDEKKQYSYSIMSAPFPITKYRSTLIVKEHSEGVSEVTWSGSFEPEDGINEEAVIKLFNEIYSDGLKALSDNF